MSKRSSRSVILGIAMVLVVVFGLSFSMTVAQDATPVPLPTATDIPAVELGTGGTHISFWNGLTGSDGVPD